MAMRCRKVSGARAIGRFLDDIDAERPHGLDAPFGAAVDRLLQQWNEQELRAEDEKRDQRHPRLREDHVAEYAQQHAAVEQRLREAGADEAADRLNLRDDHRDLDAFLPRRGRACRSGRRGRVHLQAQALVRGLAHGAAIDVHHQLEASVQERHPDVNQAQRSDELPPPAVDRAIDDAPLQLERHQLDQEQRHREQRQQHLVPGADLPDVPVKVFHHPRIIWDDPC